MDFGTRLRAFLSSMEHLSETSCVIICAFFAGNLYDPVFIAYSLLYLVFLIIIRSVIGVQEDSGVRDYCNLQVDRGIDQVLVHAEST